MVNNKKIVSYRIILDPRGEFINSSSTIQERREALDYTLGILITYDDDTQGVLDNSIELKDIMKDYSIEEKANILKESLISHIPAKEYDMYLSGKLISKPTRVLSAYDRFLALKHPETEYGKPVDILDINKPDARGTVAVHGMTAAKIGSTMLGSPTHHFTVKRKISSKMKEISSKLGDWWNKYKKRVSAIAGAALISAGLVTGGIAIGKNIVKKDITDPRAGSTVTSASDTIVGKGRNQVVVANLTLEQQNYLEQKGSFCSITDTLASRIPNELILSDGKKLTLTDEEKANYAISGHEFDSLRAYFSDRSNFMATVGLQSYEEMREARNVARIKLLILATQATENEFGLFDNMFINEEDKAACRELLANIVNGCTPEVAMKQVLDMWDLKNPQMKAFVGSYVIPIYSAAGILDEADMNKHNFTFVLKEYSPEEYEKKVVQQGMIPVHEIEERFCGATAMRIMDLAADSLDLQKYQTKTSFMIENDKVNDKHNHDISSEKLDEFYVQGNKVFESIYIPLRIKIGTLPADFGYGQAPTGGSYSTSKTTTVQKQVGRDAAQSLDPSGFQRIENETKAETNSNREQAIAEIKDNLPDGVDPETVGKVTGNEEETVRKEEVVGDVVITDKIPTDGPLYEKKPDGSFTEIPGEVKPSEPTGEGDKMNDLIDAANKEAATGGVKPEIPDNGGSLETPDNGGNDENITYPPATGGIIGSEDGPFVPITEAPMVPESTQSSSAPVAVETPVVEAPMVPESTQSSSAPVAVETPVVEAPMVPESTQSSSAPVAVETPVVEAPMVPESTQISSAPVAVETPVVEAPAIVAIGPTQAELEEAARQIVDQMAEPVAEVTVEEIQK